MFTLILQMKDHIQQQDKTNERILKEIEDVKKQKKTAEDHSPLVPRSLNFDTPVVTSQPSAVQTFNMLEDQKECIMGHQQ